MTFQILGDTTDQRTNTNVIYCKCSVDEYLNLIGHDFENFSIQRKKESHKAYQRLKNDLINGALLPSITLAVKPHKVPDITAVINDKTKLANILSKEGNVDILDGLQRTYIISDIKQTGVDFKDGQELLLEYWVEADLSKLIYRMIILNAGQKAMSMRHQIELLFMSLKETVCGKIEDIDIFVERDGDSRTEPNKYSLNNIVSAYQAFITKSTELDKHNIVSNELKRNNVMDSSEDELTEQFEQFLIYFKLIKEIDSLAWNYYHNNFDNKELIRLQNINNEDITEEEQQKIEQLKLLKQAHRWLGSENVFLALFCAISRYSGTAKKDRIKSALERLRISLENDDSDPLGFLEYQKQRAMINPRKSNVGVATRKLLLNGFMEFFRDDGYTQMEECWRLAVD